MTAPQAPSKVPNPETLVPSSSSPPPPPPSLKPSVVRGSEEEFPRAVARVAVARICQAIGFRAVQRSALDSLVDIALRFIGELGKASRNYANIAGRTESNVFDLLLASEDLLPGGGGGHVPRKAPLSSSTTLKDLMRFVEFAEEIPFPFSLPKFPLPRSRAASHPPSFAQLAEDTAVPPPSHIPSWLPAFPDEHTYKRTPVWGGGARRPDPQTEKLEQARQRRKAERSLVSLHLRLASNLGTPTTATATPTPTIPLTPTPMPSSLDSDLAKIKGKKAIDASLNPFLSSPLPLEEAPNLPSSLLPIKHAPPLPLKRKNGHNAPSVLDAFAPAIEVATNDDPFPISNNNKPLPVSSLPNIKERAPVLLTFDFGRRASQKAERANLSLSVNPNRERKRGKLPSKDDEKDDKKRRAEQILAQAMEGVEETL